MKVYSNKISDGRVIKQVVDRESFPFYLFKIVVWNDYYEDGP